jgi:pimeloyl-ACP methyl ester carboxylesterase
VYKLLTEEDFKVSIVQNQTLSLESDVETTTNVLDLQDGPAILVGHSYGGAVITEAGTHGSVAGLVYITAFAPDQGESVNTLIANPPPGAPVPPILPPQDGFLFLDREQFAQAFAADLLKLWPALWTFTHKQGVSPTNNHAERALRGAVIYRKLSLGSQSEDGETRIARLMSAHTTCRLQNRSLFDYLAKALDHHARRAPIPLLA